jgi:hypothetical protein
MGKKKQKGLFVKKMYITKNKNIKKIINCENA